ncbi:MAG: type I DNA topoisomerase [Corallococcus sp.]|nr:type I DNA topoisomerase [Corallococcus sp.]
MKLVIVESPAKAKTISKYLGEGYIVDASRGHIMDLPEKTMGVDIKNDYKPVYEIRTAEQRDTVARLKAKVKTAEQVFLATDPDREGEAISWHLQTALKLNPNEKNRIMFNEISKKAVNKAIQNPDYVNMNLVDAQQARRVLDRLVGYTLSPVLCKKVQNKLSAGRVQSAALGMIVEREKEITAFKPEEYWVVSALLEKKNLKPQFKATLTEYCGKKFKITCEEQCKDVLSHIKDKPYKVLHVKKSVTSSKPQPPFTTSTLQQDAVNKLHMSSAATMQVAQQLYEGFDIDGLGHVALITYIRTDSVRVASDAVESAREYILSKYGKEYLPEKANFYATKKQAQDAHEAIRPINLSLTPESLKDKLQKNQYSLYKLIYQRFLASQAANAQYNSVSVTIDCDGYGFTASGKTLLFDGYTAIYSSVSTKDKDKDDDDNVRMPQLTEGEEIKLVKITNEQKFTKPPQRYSEASIIKAMEERGIGRPSTYATVMQTLLKREYVKKDAKYLVPTELGQTVTEYLSQHFPDIVNVEFTADMENRLDSIADDGALWYNVVDEFYKPLLNEVSEAMKQDGLKVADQPSDEICELCGAPMVYKTGRYGKYLACSNYPTCSNHRSLTQKSQPKETDQKCELCGSVMLEREGKFGKYLACSNYPNCKNTKSISEVVAKCPKCGKDIVKRISKRGTVFYGCTGYPDCDFVSWDVPTGKLCPKCGKHLVYKESRGIKSVKCSDKDCDYVSEE